LAFARTPPNDEAFGIADGSARSPCPFAIISALGIVVSRPGKTAFGNVS